MDSEVTQILIVRWWYLNDCYLKKLNSDIANIKTQIEILEIKATVIKLGTNWTFEKGSLVTMRSLQ